jgi:hypothetical protein
MKGTVVWIDPNNNELIKVKTENGSIALIELLGHQVEIGDVIKGNLEDLGGEPLYNVTQQEELDVSIENLF